MTFQPLPFCYTFKALLPLYTSCATNEEKLCNKTITVKGLNPGVISKGWVWSSGWRPGLWYCYQGKVFKLWLKCLDMANKILLYNSEPVLMATFQNMWLLWVLVGRTYMDLLVLNHNDDGNFIVGCTAKIHLRCADYMYWLNLFNTINWRDATQFDLGMTTTQVVKTQSLSTTTVLFRTTFTRMIILNLLTS